MCENGLTKTALASTGASFFEMFLFWVDEEGSYKKCTMILYVHLAFYVFYLHIPSPINQESILSFTF